MNTSSESRGGTGAGSAAAARVNHKAFWLFPDVDRTLVSRMRMDDVAMYSTTDQRSADQICDCLAGLLPDLRSCSVLDATACSGGSTFAFSRRFGRVEAVELDRQRFLDMVHNLRTLGVRVSWVTPELCRAPSIQVIRGDAVERLAAALPGAYDVVFVDPPWGGPHVYRATPLLQLSLSGIPLSRVVRDALKRRTARFVALKVPANFDVSEMEEGSGGCVWADRSIGGGRMRLLVLSAAAEEKKMDEVRRYHQLRKMLEDEAEAERLQEAGVLRNGEAGGEEYDDVGAGEEEAASTSHPATRSQIDEFKKEVRAWMDLDIVIKNLSGMLRERRAHKKALTDRIVGFMNAHNIDDLDTREGNIRSRVSFVKPPLSQRMIRESLHSYFAHNEAVATQVLNSVFNRDRERVERASLRLRPPSKQSSKLLIAGPSPTSSPA